MSPFSQLFPLTGWQNVNGSPYKSEPPSPFDKKTAKFQPPIVQQRIWIAPKSVVDHPTARYLIQERERLILDRNVKVNGLLSLLSLGMTIPLATSHFWASLPCLLIPAIFGTQALDQFGKLNELEQHTQTHYTFDPEND